ncbi:hypothetical protein BH23GEM11_BH23GEM11_10690 [soil metagenome]
MRFAGKIHLVREAQAIINVRMIDGVPGPVTWKALEQTITGRLRGSSVHEHIRNVQASLGLKVDGIDGPVTWKAILVDLKDRNINKSLYATDVTTGFPQVVRLSAQTTGNNAVRITPQAIILHDTCGNGEGSVEWTNRIHTPNGGMLYASYHCIVFRNGKRVITNDDTNRAYHAGESIFKGRRNLNLWSIGVAWERDSNTEPLQDTAIDSAMEYIIPRLRKWNLTPDDMADHRTISPGRKVDLKESEYDRFMVRLRDRWSATP